MGSWQGVLLEPAKQMLTQIGQFLLKAFSVIVLLVIGWLVAKVVKVFVTKVLRAAQLDKFSDWVELDNMLAKGGIKYSLSELLGLLSYWIILLVTFMVTLSAVNLIPATVLDRVISYIPNVITAIFILILGMFAATLLKNIVQTASANAGITYAELLAKLTHTIIIAFVIFIILEQLKIGLRITEITLSIALGSVGLGLALAFGLGCRDIAGKFIEELIEKLKKK
jgi:hypothetical protein